MPRQPEPRAPRRTLLEWLIGGVATEVPNSRLAAALRSREGEVWSAWLVRASDTLGWDTEVVEAPLTGVAGERECWWVTCVPRGQEQWLIISGQRGDEARASIIDGQQVRDVGLSAVQMAAAVGIEDVKETLVWVRVCPTAPLRNVRSPPTGPKISAPARLRRWASRERTAVAAVVAYSIVIGVISLALPLGVQSLVNSLAFGTVLQPLIVISLVLLLLVSLGAALRVLEVYIVELLLRRVFSDVARDVARRLPAAVRETGGKWGLTEIINRFFDVPGLQKSASFLLLNATEVVMATFAGLVVLAFYHPFLLAFDLLLLVALAFVLFGLGTGGVRTAIRESASKYELAAWLESIARRQRRFAAPAGAAWGARQTERLLLDWLGNRDRHFRIVLRQTIGLAIIQAIGSAGLLGIGAFLVWEGQLTLGQLVASELIITAVVAQLAKFGKHVETFYNLNASIEKVGILLDIETEPRGGELLEDKPDGISVHLQDLKLVGVSCSLSIAPGEHVALEGMPRAARRQLFDLVYGFEPLKNGELQLDGIAANVLAPRMRRHWIALVREGYPVGATLEENLTSHDARYTTIDLRALLASVGLADLPDRLPHGLQSWIYPDGEPLDDNQLIALEIARAISQRPRLLLVDQALDRVHEHYLPILWQALSQGDAAWTLIVATDRPEVASRCSRSYRWSESGLSEQAQ